MLASLARFKRAHRGCALPEYALTALGVTLMCLGAWTLAGEALLDAYSNIAEALSFDTPQGGDE